ncbi:MAG: trigger factor [Firmicutes bacterium]|nr:trigger factor [Bacillota bacterium]
MKTTFISKEKNTVKFTMEFTAEEFEAAQIKAYQATKDQFPVDGFRKGKAPRKLIEAKYGEGVFFGDAVDSMFSENYEAALLELKLDVIDRPNVDFTELKKGQGFTVTVAVEVFPTVEVKNYKGVKIEKVENVVTDADVEKELENLRKRNARMVDVDRAVENGDTVILDYKGFVGDNQFQGGTAEGQSLKIGSGTFIPGFEEQLIGVKPGESKDVVVTFPEEYHADDLAGKEATFKCTVHQVKFEELPELDDEFVKDISEFDTLDEFKADKKKELEKAAEARAVNEMKNKALEAVCEANEFDVPQVMIENEIDAIAQDFNQQLSYQGMNLEMYLGFIQKDYAAFKEEMRPQAERNVKSRLVLFGVAEAENLTATQEDVDKEIELMAMQYQMEAAKVKELLGPENMAAIQKDVRLRNAMDIIYSNAKIGKAAKAKTEKAEKAEKTEKAEKPAKTTKAKTAKTEKEKK